MRVDERWRGPAAAALAAVLLVLVAGCGMERPVVAPGGPKLFEDLVYRPAQERYRQRMEERYEHQDLSYLISLLDYAQASYYARDREAARRSFTAAYKVDDGDIPEAAKFFNWLQEDGRKVYRLDKRERELVHYYLGLDYLLDGNLEESLVEFKKLRLRDMGVSQLPAVNFWMGLVYELSGQYDDARIEYEGLAAMGQSGVDGERLAAMAESLATGRHDPPEDSFDLVVAVDHLFGASLGPARVWADDELVAVLPGYVDAFDVKLTADEAARKAAQEASAEVTRQGLRFLGKVLSQVLFKDDRVGDIAADLAFGTREDREDTRYWGRAPVALAFGRVRIPAATREVRVEFAGPGGELGSSRYPLAGEHARADRVGRVALITAGLASDFYGY